MEFCERLLTAMRARDKKQTDVVQGTGIPKGSISQYCKGGFVPKYENTVKIAEYLNINPDWLLLGTGNMEFTEEEKMYNAMAEREGRFNDLMIIAERLNPESLKELIRYGEYLLNK